MTASLNALIDRALQRLPQAATLAAADRTRLGKLALASDAAIDTLVQQPALLAHLLASDAPAPLPPPALLAENQPEWGSLLRRWRRAESARLIWRSVHGSDDTCATLQGSTQLAETCLQRALDALWHNFASRHGQVRDAAGRPQQLVVFGLGKLGGGELNFSSDVDLVYAYAEDGQSDGARSLSAETYFARLGQQLARLLDETTAEGFCHRVDLRLRPYGNAGRIAWSFAALEHYFLREGRDWERYAWQKARPVAGDLDAGERFLTHIKPFIYRRYLDFGALDGLREMKAMINREVARKDCHDDIKRGPGGIREIEFFVQALQLVRGGREPALQLRGLLPALAALVAGGQVAASTGEALQHHYLYLRRLENHLQMLRDAQTHRLPEHPEDQARLAALWPHPDWRTLLAELDGVRRAVSEEFAALLTPRGKGTPPDALARYWQALPDAGDAQALADAGFADSQTLDAHLRHFLRSPLLRQSSDISRTRLGRVMPALLAACAAASEPDATAQRALPLVQSILRRSSYLALLDEHPPALKRLVDALSRSALLGERLAQYPVLLDELLDTRSRSALPDAAQMQAACQQALERAGDDTEAALRLLGETRQAISFRIALATLDGRQCGSDSARQLAQLADAVTAAVLQLAQTHMQRAHGRIAGAHFAIIGYGSLGGMELGFGSDLDLVFLYDAPADAESDGARPLDAPRWFARLAQKIVGYLQTPTAAGRLFDVDVRLRPDGSKAMLVSALESFASYQHERAWVWEQQALVRARAIAGDAPLCQQFEQIRHSVLCRPRDADTLRDEVARMRQKMRAGLDRSTAALVDLKQGDGALVDVEFLLQYLTLRHAPAQPAATAPSNSRALLAHLAAQGTLEASRAEALLDAHRQLLNAALACTLDRRQRLAAPDAALRAATATVREALAHFGLTAPPLPDAGTDMP